jgi:hypothetical protein
MTDILVLILVGVGAVIGLLMTDFDDRRHAAPGVLIAVSILVFGWFSVVGIALWGTWALVKQARRRRIERRQTELKTAMWTRSLTRSEFERVRKGTMTGASAR